MLYSLFLLYVQIEVYQNVLKLSSLPCAFTMFFVTESSILDVARDCKYTYEGTQMSLQNVRSSHELSLLGKTNLLFINTWLLSLLLEIHNEAADEQCHDDTDFVIFVVETLEILGNECEVVFSCYKNVYVNSFSPRTVKFWNSLPIECIPLTYDLSGFKSRTSRHLLTVGSF